MIRQNLHTHTVYDDGKNTPLEMAEAAISAGLTSLGFSGHSVLPYENDWSMTEDASRAYNADIEALRKAMQGRLTIFRGLEWDHTSAPPEGYDYVIGSVHHIPEVAPYFTVDWERVHTEEAIAGHFRGDPNALASAYFAQYKKVAEAPAVDIVGHFDLLTKYDEPDPLFDPDAPVYRDASFAAMDVLLKAGKIFEVNTGAISRGYRTAPYPSISLLRELRARNARICVTSDAHSADAVACAFKETEALLRSLGFTEIWELTKKGFAPAAL